MTAAAETTRATVDAVGKRWGASSGLDPVSLVLSAGRLVVVKGRSGSGKSTLLAILAGWCEPDSGTVSRAGPLASTWTTWQGTAVVPQVLGNVAEMTVAENIELPLRLAGQTRTAIAADVVDVAARLDLGEQLDRTPSEISVGQQQRLAVARAVVVRPTLILADEPTSHQDVDHAAMVIAALRHACDTGAAVLIASHDPTVVATADEVIDLDT